MKKKPLILVSATLIAIAVVAFLISGFKGGDESRQATGTGTSGTFESDALRAPAELPAILHATNVGGEFMLQATDPEGERTVDLLEEPAMDPIWSPDGQEIMFVGETGGTGKTRLGLHRIAADGKIDLVKKGPQVPSRMSFREGTDEIAVQTTFQSPGENAGIKSYSSVDSLNVETGSQKTIFDAGGSVYSPAWSPDGEELLVVVGKPGCRRKGICPQRIDVLAPEGAVLRSLIDSGAAGSPAWSPDGKMIAFTWDQGNGPAVWVVEAEGGTPSRVTAGKAPVSDPEFSPDGRKVVFSRNCDLFTQSTDGGPAANITSTPDLCEITPDWRDTKP